MITALYAICKGVPQVITKLGHAGNYTLAGNLSKLVLIFDMLAGRLEIFPILILFSRYSWKHK